MKQTVLIADDERDIIDLLKGLFEEDFHLVFALDGDEVFEQLTTSIDIIILDMHLPGRSGIEICKHIATIDSERRPAIIVISGDTSDRLVKSAYDLGISDYIGKPFNLVTFHERIIRFSRDIKALHELEQKDKKIESLAQTAMKQAASYGRALELVAKLNDCRSPLDIMHAVANNMLSQDLKIAIQLRSDTETYSYDVDTGECSPVELQIFDVLKEHGRIYHFGRRTIFNDQYVSILFKNMPFEGTLSFDAVLDVAAKFILAVNSRFISLLQQQSLISTKNKLGSALEMLGQGINNMEAERRELIDQIELNISLSFHELDMSEEQEQFFVSLIEKEVRSREKSTNLSALQALIKQCVDEMMLSEVEVPPQDENNGVSDCDIELF